MVEIKNKPLPKRGRQKQGFHEAACSIPESLEVTTSPQYAMDKATNTFESMKRLKDQLSECYKNVQNQE